MATNQNKRSSSTRYVWRKVKISGGAPEGPAPKAANRRWHGLTPRDPKASLTITVSYKGGAESWWLVKARGRSAAIPGHRALDDALGEICQTWRATE